MADVVTPEPGKAHRRVTADESASATRTSATNRGPGRSRADISGAAAIVLAGGRGARLGALSALRCKPALPFGGGFRTIDFALSNCVNSGFRDIGIAVQHKAETLVPHLTEQWHANPGRDGSASTGIEIWRPTLAGGYAGTADAVYQNLHRLRSRQCEQVLIAAADQVYRGDLGELLRRHRDSGAQVTVACQIVAARDAHKFGILETHHGEVTAFREKPEHLNPASLPLASLGIYVFDLKTLARLLDADSRQLLSTHDFGNDILPQCVADPRILVRAEQLTDPVTGGTAYWRDVGTIGDFWRANMELLRVPPSLEVNSGIWPILPDSPAPSGSGENNRVQFPGSRVSQSLIGPGVSIDNATVLRCVVFPQVRIEPGCVIEDCILMRGAQVRRNVWLQRAIVEEGACIHSSPCSAETDGAGDDGIVVLAGETSTVPQLKSA